MTIEVDKRLEFLTALVVAYKEKIAQNKDDFDWVEYPENEYVRSLIERINIEKKEYLLLAPLDEDSDDVFAFRIDKVNDKEEYNLV